MKKKIFSSLAVFSLTLSLGTAALADSKSSNGVVTLMKDCGVIGPNGHLICWVDPNL